MTDLDDRVFTPPWGFRYFGWATSGGGIRAAWRESKLHLTRVGDGVPDVRRTVCEREPPTRRGVAVEMPDAYQPRYSGRGVCKRCVLIALRESSHRLTVGRRSIRGGHPVRGMGNLYSTRGTCKCGETFRCDTKREVEQDHRSHVESVALGGVWEIRDHKTDEVQWRSTSPAGVASRLGYYHGTEGMECDPASFVEGESFSHRYRGRDDLLFQVHRVAMPLLPDPEAV